VPVQQASLRGFGALEDFGRPVIAASLAIGICPGTVRVHPSEQAASPIQRYVMVPQGDISLASELTAGLLGWRRVIREIAGPSAVGQT